MLPKSLLLCCRGDWRLCCWKTCLKIRSRSTEPKSLAWANVTGSARTCRKNSQKTLLEFVTAIISSKSLNWFVFFNCDLKISLFLLQLQFNQSSLLLEFHFWHLDTIVWWKCFLWRRKSFPELQATQSVKDWDIGVRVDNTDALSASVATFRRDAWLRREQHQHYDFWSNDNLMDCLKSGRGNQTFWYLWLLLLPPMP